MIEHIDSYAGIYYTLVAAVVWIVCCWYDREKISEGGDNIHETGVALLSILWLPALFCAAMFLWVVLMFKCFETLSKWTVIGLTKLKKKVNNES